MKLADGVIFLSEYAKGKILPLVGHSVRNKVIPHGIEPRFFRAPTPQVRGADPFRLLYVSTVDLYKHQWNVAEAVDSLRRMGVAVELTLVGPVSKWAASRFHETLKRLDPQRRFIHHIDRQPHSGLHEIYHSADGFVFASTCENLPNVILEAMASGLPIASSRSGPMPSILGDAALYFDPEDVETISSALFQLISSTAVRDRVARRAYEQASKYSWSTCAQDTLQFIVAVARDQVRNQNPQ
jgi:glycosyltransferase involved in cell wall biosynthesis